MGKLSKAIAKDIARAHQESLKEDEGPELLPNGNPNGDDENLMMKNSMRNSLKPLSISLVCNKEAKNCSWPNNEHSPDIQESEEDEEEDEGLPSVYDVYMEVYDYVVYMGGFLLSQQELLESHPLLRQHRMFLHGAVLDCSPGNPQSTISESFFNF